MEKVKKIWKIIWPIIWWIILILLVIASFWGSYIHAQNDKEFRMESTKLDMKLGSVLTESILQRYDFDISKRQLDSIYTLESERIIKNIYKK